MTKGWLLSISCAAIGLMLFLGLTSPTAARSLRPDGGSSIRYVAPGGTDIGSCTSAALPCATLQYAVQRAEAGDEIHLAAGRYTALYAHDGLTCVAHITQNLAVRGGYSPDFTLWDPDQYTSTLDAHEAGRGILIEGPLTATFEALEITGGAITATATTGCADSGAGLCAISSTVSISRCYIHDNRASSNGEGGGLYVEGGVLILNASLIEGNSAGGGGGVAIVNSRAKIVDSFFSRNRAGGGGGIFCVGSHLWIEGTTIRDNTYSAGSAVDIFSSRGTLTRNTFEHNSGGLYISRSAITLTHNTFTSNSRWEDGGGVMWRDSDFALIRGNRFINNSTAEGFGGGMYLDVDYAIIEDNLWTDNTGDEGAALHFLGSGIIRGNRFIDNSGGDDEGGAIAIYGNNVLLSRNVISQNYAYGGGGGLYLRGEAITLTDNLIADNRTYGEGGGVLAIGEIFISHTTFLNNQALGAKGGGLYLNGTLTMTRSLFQGNTSSYLPGGGIALSSSRARIQASRIISNAAPHSYGGGIYAERSAVTFVNSVLARNTAESEGGGGAYLTQSDLHLIHATVADNLAPLNDALALTETSRAALTNTILSGQTLGISAGLGCAATADGLLWHEVTSPTWGAGSFFITHTWEGDPAFADPTRGDYHLRHNSEAIDLGADAGIARDLDGDPRPYGAGYDLGADEFIPVPPRLVTIVGPSSGDLTTHAFTFTAHLNPPNLSPPIRYTWSPPPDEGQGTAMARYRWDDAGPHLITLTVENDLGSGEAVHNCYLFPAEEGLFAYAAASAERAEVRMPVVFTLTLVSEVSRTVGVYVPLRGLTAFQWGQTSSHPQEDGGLLYSQGTITGALSLAPHAPLTYTFTARPDGSRGRVGVRLYVNPVGPVDPASLGALVWSNEAALTIPIRLYLPLLLRH